MRVYTKDVNSAYVDLIDAMSSHGVRSSSRNGPVTKIPEPILITYEEPTSRVLLSARRDANPFFHLYHALWLLAGRDDAAAPSRLVKRYADYSDDGVTMNGSYGRRWRRAKYQEPDHYGKRFADQLHVIVQHLKFDPASRRAVLQMWNVEDDLLKIDSSRDVCCNTAAYFSVVGGRLEMTVTSRSSDLVWGLLGEDYVTFTVLQEYVASAVGIDVGRYHHMANDLHVYVDRGMDEDPVDDSGLEEFSRTRVALVSPGFDEELSAVVERHATAQTTRARWRCEFFDRVLEPMMVSHATRDEMMVDEIADSTWRTAARRWIQRRRKS